MEEPLFEHHRIAVDHGQNPMRLDQYLGMRLHGLSRTRIQAGIQEGGVRINEKEVRKNSYLVKGGETIQVMLPNPPRTDKILGEDIPIDIVYEDRDVLVVNKAAEMVVHPAHGNWTGTLVNALIHKFEKLPQIESNKGRPGLLHRIDKGTSGLLVVAKSEKALAGITRQFMNHEVERKYYALVWGQVKEDQGTIDAPVGRSESDRRRMKVYPPEGERGKKAITHYQIEEQLGYVTLISCRLETGRTHQIRAHMQYLGHPLFGDTRYRGDQIVYGPRFSKYKSFVENCFAILPHQALHAATLGFTHPTNGKKLSFSVPVPLSFEKILVRWRTFFEAKNGLVM